MFDNQIIRILKKWNYENNNFCMLGLIPLSTQQK